MAIFVLLLIVVSFMAVILHSMSYYNVPTYSSEEPDSSSEWVVFSPAYIAKRDTNIFLEIVALLVLSTAIFGAGLLNYLKKPESSK